MSPVAENVVSKYESSPEITQNTDQSIPGTILREEYTFYTSEDSLDSCEEKSNTQAYTNPNKKPKLKLRSLSACIADETGASSPCQKGILKYTNSRFRSLSESCSDHYCGSLSNNGESISALDELFEELEDPESENQKVKKTVRFSDKVHKQLFRSTSSILGQRKKNQRKQANKKGLKTHAHNSNQDERHDSKPSSNSTSEEDLSNIGDALECVTLSDSGIEAEDSDHGSTTNLAQQSFITTPKKNKKQKRSKNNRRRAASESSAGEMIFDLDL